MATYYPEDNRHEADDLSVKINKLQIRNMELNVQLMRKSAQLSEAEEKLRRWETELEILANQGGHNLCQVGIPKLLKNTIGHTGIYPDLEGVTREEFRAGCEAYIDDLFGKSGLES